ncbi:hypothetical protein GCM10009604_06970 [Corynebacterium aurimucosum]
MDHSVKGLEPPFSSLQHPTGSRTRVERRADPNERAALAHPALFGEGENGFYLAPGEATRKFCF